MNHKRKKAKYARAGAKCDPYTSNAFKDVFEYQHHQEKRAIISEKEQVEDLYNGRSENGARD